LEGGENVNLGIMQLSNINMNPSSNSKVTSSSQGVNTNAKGDVNNKFGAIFNKILAEQNSVNESAYSTTENEIDLNKLSNLINSESANEVLELLGISHDEGLLMIQGANEDSVKSIDELMNLEDLLALLNMDQTQLQDILPEVLGTEQQNLNVNNVWELIQEINEQGSNLVTQIASSLQGEHKLTPKESEQLLQLLKLGQVIGGKSDLTSDQTIQLQNLKEVLKEIVESTDLNHDKTIKTIVEVTAQKSTTGNASLQGFQQVVKQVETSSETQQTISVQQPIDAAPKTVTITLPVEKSAQGEALVKEIQQLIGRSQFSNAPGNMKLLLKLYPENLGSIRIEVMQKDGVLSVRLLASTTQAKELLDSQINQLKTSFAQANIQMDRIDIAQSLQETDRNLRDQNLFSNFFNQQDEQENDSEDNKDDEEEHISFQDYLINEGV